MSKSTEQKKQKIEKSYYLWVCHIEGWFIFLFLN